MELRLALSAPTMSKAVPWAGVQIGVPTQPPGPHLSGERVRHDEPAPARPGRDTPGPVPVRIAAPYGRVPAVSHGARGGTPDGRDARRGSTGRGASGGAGPGTPGATAVPSDPPPSHSGATPPHGRWSCAAADAVPTAPTTAPAARATVAAPRAAALFNPLIMFRPFRTNRG